MIYWIRGCCQTPLDQQHSGDCPEMVRQRQSTDEYCRIGDVIAARKSRATAENASDGKGLSPTSHGASLARAMRQG